MCGGDRGAECDGGTDTCLGYQDQGYPSLRVSCPPWLRFSQCPQGLIGCQGPGRPWHVTPILCVLVANVALILGWPSLSLPAQGWTRTSGLSRLRVWTGWIWLDPAQTSSVLYKVVTLQPPPQVGFGHVLVLPEEIPRKWPWQCVLGVPPSSCGHWDFPWPSMWLWHV